MEGPGCSVRGRVRASSGGGVGRPSASGSEGREERGLLDKDVENNWLSGGGDGYAVPITEPVSVKPDCCRDGKGGESTQETCR